MKNAPQWTPLHIELLLHYYSKCNQLENHDAPAVVDYRIELVRNGLIEATTERDSGYKTTPRGAAMVELICRTPIPTARFVSRDGEDLGSAEP